MNQNWIKHCQCDYQTFHLQVPNLSIYREFTVIRHEPLKKTHNGCKNSRCLLWCLRVRAQVWTPQSYSHGWVRGRDRHDGRGDPRRNGILRGMNYTKLAIPNVYETVVLGCVKKKSIFDQIINIRVRKQKNFKTFSVFIFSNFIYLPFFQNPFLAANLYIAVLLILYQNYCS